MIELVFKNFKAVSVNKLYAGNSRRFLSKEGKAFKAEFSMRMKHAGIDLTKLKKLKGKKLKLELIIESDTWMLKDGVTPRIKDSSNYLKIIQDCLFNEFNELLGKKKVLDDCQIFENVVKKLVGTEENIHLILTEWSE